MPDQIPIVFTADTSALTTAAEALKNLGAISQEQFDNFNAANAANAKVMADLATRQKEASSATEKSTATIETLADGVKNLNQAIQVGATEKLSQSLVKVKDTSLAAATAHRAHTLEMRELTKAGATADRTMQFFTQTAMSGANAMMMFSMAMGSGDEKSQKASEELMKTMGIMQMLMAATELLTFMREEGGLKNILMTKLDTATQSENIVVKWAAVAAQTALNAVLALNPFGIILIALAAIGLAFESWNNQTKSSIELLQEEIKANDELAESLAQARDAAEAAHTADMKLAKARGANAEELHKLNQAFMRDEIEKMNFEISNAQKSLEDQAEINKAKLEDHITFWGAFGSVITTGFGIWGNMEDSIKEKVENNNKGLLDEYNKRKKAIDDLINKQKELKAEFLDDKSGEKQEGEDKAAKDKEARDKANAQKLKDEKANEDDMLKQLEDYQDAVERQNATFAADDKKDKEKALKDSQDAQQYAIDQMLSNNANKVDIINAERAKEIEAAQGDADKLLQIDMKYNAQLIALAKQTNDAIAKAQADADKKAEDAMNAKVKKITDSAKEVQNVADAAINFQEQLENNKFKDEMDHIDQLHDAHQMSDSQYAAEKKKIMAEEKAAKKKAAEEERIIKLGMAIVDSAAAILKITASMAAPLNIPLLIEQGALSALNIATIATAKFAKGTKNAPPGFKLVGEEGPELLYDGGGYAVIPNPDTMQILQKWDIPKLEHPMYNSSFSLNHEGINDAITNMTHNQTLTIDYDVLAKKIGKEFGQHLSKLPETKTIFDANGFTEFVKNRDSVRTYINGRFNK